MPIAEVLAWIFGLALPPIVAFGVTRYLRLQRLEKDRRSQGQLVSDTRTELDKMRVELEKAQQDLEKSRNSLKTAIDSMPARSEMTHGIAIVGTSGCGKTMLTLTWANPTFKQEDVQGTEFDEYRRTVGRSDDPDGPNQVDHVLRFFDWRGEDRKKAVEHILTIGGVKALLFVVDLGVMDAKQNKQIFSQERIQQQIEMFDKDVLDFFFLPGIVSKCTHCVLFINKSDLISGFYREVEQKARELYKPLIDVMSRMCNAHGVYFKDFVGSADSGHNVNRLFPYLIENLLGGIVETINEFKQKREPQVKVAPGEARANRIADPRRTERS